MSSRSAATALGKLTWLLAISFLATSISLTVLAARNSAQESVLDKPIAEGDATGVVTPPAADLIPPSTGDAPLTPPRVD